MKELKVKEEYNVALVLAAGSGKRMHSKEAKPYIDLAGKPIVAYSLETFEACPFIHETVLVVASEYEKYAKDQIVKKYGFSKVKTVVVGGRERFNSVYEGLRAIRKILAGKDMLNGKSGDAQLKDDRECFVFIHDGARPFITQEILERVYEGVRENGACVAGMPLKFTVKLVDKNGLVEATPERGRLKEIQTPQVFTFDLITESYKRCMEYHEEGLTDDAMTVERMTRHDVKIVDGSYDNIKITTPQDLRIGELYLTQNRQR